MQLATSSFAKFIPLCLLSAGLTACTTVPETNRPDYGPLTPDGFSMRADGAFYHVETGLYCPPVINGMPFLKTSVFQKDRDISCSYLGEGRGVTIYALDHGSVADISVLENEFEAILNDIISIEDDDPWQFSPANTAQCLMAPPIVAFGPPFFQVADNPFPEMGCVKLEHLTNGEEGTTMPYRVGVFESRGLKSYLAMSVKSEAVITVRYTVVSQTSSSALTEDCERLHAMTWQTLETLKLEDGLTEIDTTRFQVIAE